MSSEKLGHNNNVLKETLGGGFDILTGSSGEYTDLGIARRFGGAAAAYSLRDIGAMNGPVVRVRRSSDSTETIDDEENFSANQVASGALEDWVNGKLETTLPADVATAAAAYSFRKVKASYAEDAVRIRRISDGVEVEVAFDSDDKVSASSPITDGGTELTPDPDADLGSTSATTLGGFLTESVTYFDTTGASSNTVQGLPLIAGGDIGTVTFNASDGFGGDASFTFTGAGTGSGFADNFYWNRTFSTGEFLGTASSEKTVTIQAYVKRTNGNIGDSLNFREYGTSNKATFTDLPLNEWKLVTGTIPTTDAGDNDHIQIGGTSGTTFKLSLVKYSVNLQDAFVHTWYDQAGSNDVVQDTADNQPKIAENGALLADGISFDGDFFLQKTTTDTTTAASIFGVHTKGTSSSSSARPMGYQESTSSGTNSLAFAMDNTLRFDGAATSTGSQTIPASGLFLSTTIKVSNTEANHFLNSVSNIANSSLTLNDTDVRFTLGFASTTPNYSYDGSIQEAIFYTSDQSDNRFKIESNINNYYGLYTFQGDGFVETWYDQSGNGNDATQGTAGNQPKIVSSGSLLITSQGKPAIDMINGTITKLAMASEINMQSLFAVNSIPNVGGTAQVLVGKIDTNNKYFRYKGSGANFAPMANNAAESAQAPNTPLLITVDATHIIEYNRDDSNDNTIFVSGTQATLSTNTITSDIPINGIGVRQSTADPHSGKIQEIIMFEGDKSGDRVDLRNDMANFYNITLS
jgi:hypothetical protein